MNTLEIIATMRSIVNAPGFRFLESNKSDFHKHDVENLTENFSPGARYLWVVNLYGTHLTRIGVHARENDWAIAAIECGMKSSPSGVAIYLVSSKGVQLLDHAQAMREIKIFDYTVKGSMISAPRLENVVSFEVQTYHKAGDGNVYGRVAFCTGVLGALTKADLTALRTIAVSEAVAAARSFFVKVESIQINEFALNELITPTKIVVTEELEFA